MTRFSLSGKGFLNCCRAQSRGDENFCVSRYPTLLLMKENMPRCMRNKKQPPGTQSATWLRAHSPRPPWLSPPVYLLFISPQPPEPTGGSGEEAGDLLKISVRAGQGNTTSPLNPLPPRAVGNPKQDQGTTTSLVICWERTSEQLVNPNLLARAQVLSYHSLK